MDVNTEIRAILTSSTAASLHALVAERVYQGLLPKGHNPGDHAITFYVRGGASDPDLPLLSQSVGFHCWGGSAVSAGSTSIALSDLLRSKAVYSLGDHLFDVREEVTGVIMVDPDVGWHYVLSFYNMIFKR